MRIESLTPEQEVKLIETRDRWLKHGLCTDPAKRELVENAANKIRVSEGHTAAPSKWFDGVPTAELYINLKLTLKLSDEECEKHDADFRKFERPIGSNLLTTLKLYLEPFVPNIEDVQLHSSFCGALESYWIAYYTFPHEEIRPMHTDEQVEKLGWWKDTTEGGYWWPFDTVNVFSERPLAIHKEQNRLHNEDGPAIEFRDGWKHWVIGGVTVDEQIVMRPETQTLAQIKGEDNAEVKRIRIERYGWDKYLKAVNAVLVEHSRNEVEQTDEALMDADGMRVLICACPSTARVYAMEVPTTVTTCLAAQQWLRNQRGNCIGAS